MGGGGGRYDRVFIHSSSPFRHNDYKRLIWEQNPYVDGFTDAPPTPHYEIEHTFSLSCNLLDKLMLSYGLDDGRRMHEPEIAYKPKFREEYNKVIFDPNWISNIGDNFDIADIVAYFERNNIHIEAVMADLGGKRCFDNRIEAEFIRTQSLEDFCDLIYSAKALYCFVTGTATLAAALGKPINVFVGSNVGYSFMHSPLHTYIPLSADNRIRKEWKKEIFGIPMRISARRKTIERISKFIPTKYFQNKFKNAFISKNLHRLKPYAPHTSTEEVQNIVSIANSMLLDSNAPHNKGGGGGVTHIFEFGSRYGEDSVAFAKVLAENNIKAHIWSFECNENTIAECRRNVARYKNITLTEAAVSQSNDFISFYKINAQKTETTHYDGNQGASSTLRASGKYPIENYVQDEVRVRSVRLDSFMASNNISHIDILWMDIQGGELEALRGLGERIFDVRLIYSEVEFMEIYENQPLFDDIKDYLEKRNFIFIGFVGVCEYFANAIFIQQKYYSDSVKKLLQSDKMKKWIAKQM